MLVAVIKNLFNKYLNVVAQVHMDTKISLMFFLAHLEGNFERSYRELNSKIKINHAKGPPSEPCKNNTNEKSILRKTWWGFRWFRRVADIHQYIGIVKYILVFLLLDTQTLPIEWNCYVLGRLNVHEAYIDYVPFTAVNMTLALSLWTYFTSRFKISVALDLFIFMLTDWRLVEREKSKLAKLNDQMRLTGRRVTMSVLQRALFYQIDQDDYTIFKWRPHRTARLKKKMVADADIILSIFLIQLLLVLLSVVPWALGSIIFDCNYIRNYPTCCPHLEQLAKEDKLSAWQVTFGVCTQRILAFFIDIFDNLLFYLATTLTFLSPIAISMIVVKDMVTQWRTIDVRIKKLLATYRLMQKRQLKLELGQNIVNPSSSNKSWPLEFRYERDLSSFRLKWAKLDAEAEWRYQNWLDEEAIDVQALIIDFFEGFRRSKRILGIMISQTLVYFANIILLIAYISFKLPNFYSLVVIQYSLFSFYVLYLIVAAELLSLKRAVDGSYLDICSLMAFDRHSNVPKWVHIMDSFTHKSGTAFSIFYGLKYTWTLVFSFVASTLSGLIVVKTYQQYYIAGRESD